MGEEYLQVRIDEFTLRLKVGCWYTEDGLWVALDEARRIARIGLSDFQQLASGAVAFVELPERGMAFEGGDELASVETDKADLSVPVPFPGTVLALNTALADAPGLINREPYGAGWLAELRPEQWPVPVAGLLDAAAYRDLILRQAAGAERPLN